MASFLHTVVVLSTLLCHHNTCYHSPPVEYHLTPSFSEEFDNDHLNTEVWTTTFAPHDFKNKNIRKRTLWTNSEQQVYFDKDYLNLNINPFWIHNNTLTITASPLTDLSKSKIEKDIDINGGDAKGNADIHGVKYSSGLITTRDTFYQKYGYFEIKARWTESKGLWPAFWLMNEDGSWPAEIDIMEALGDHPNVIYQSNHSNVIPKNTGMIAHLSHGSDGHSYHTYGLMWLPDRLDYYVDGIKTNSIKSNTDNNKPMYILINLAVGGKWPGHTDDSTLFPAHMDVEYIHCWKLNG